MKKHLLRTAGSLLLLLCLLTGCGQQSSSVENSVDEAGELVKDIPSISRMRLFLRMTLKRSCFLESMRQAP